MKNHTKIFWFITFHTKPLRISFSKVDGFIRVFDETRYLILFGPEKYYAIYNRIRYLISQKSDITYVISLIYARIKVDSYDSFASRKNNDFA